MIRYIFIVLVLMLGGAIIADNFFSVILGSLGMIGLIYLPVYIHERRHI